MFTQIQVDLSSASRPISHVPQRFSKKINNGRTRMRKVHRTLLAYAQRLRLLGAPYHCICDPKSDMAIIDIIIDQCFLSRSNSQ